MSSSTNAQLAYDPLGRLYQVTAANGTITRFLYDGDALVAEYNAAGEMTRRYVHWEGADVPIISYTGASLASPTYLHPDHQGSIVAVSGASGASQINRYDEYGIPAATNAGRFQYTGQAWLAELGLYYYKARLYSPTLGRFLQTDPVGYRDQYNLYAYGGNEGIIWSEAGMIIVNIYSDIVVMAVRDSLALAVFGRTARQLFNESDTIFSNPSIQDDRIRHFMSSIRRTWGSD